MELDWKANPSVYRRRWRQRRAAARNHDIVLRSTGEHSPMTTHELDVLKQKLRQFAHERDWDRYHSPKNLAMALSGEAGELLEHFQWLTEDESRQLSTDVRQAVELEMADVLLYLISIADKLNVDLIDAAHRKIELNAQKYPVGRSHGNARKYTDF
jgi:dCTP diphosphatase